ncbi:FecR family protein [Sphingobacterium faecale]|uniref:FecR domain-containing protein n=1 Tax=Sphingobacterium faecale TaxID=2803775 RepID=A0ABS1R455_9SPHI|nr:FecR domain-containing protein [Sphingobacterium faecale]MBL1409489.1 FecR domain-containing protein [Sphingobacterium faecale]
MEANRLKELLPKYYKRDITVTEREELWRLMVDLPEEVVSSMVDETIVVDMAAPFEKENLRGAIRAEAGLVPENRKTHFRKWYPYAAAVLIAGVLSVAVLKLDFWKADSAVEVAVTPVDITLPDDKALVKLGNGSVFVVSDSLDRLETKDVAVQRVSEGIYLFDVLPQPDHKEEFLSFSTPKGVSNQVILSDGTKVWLNSSSQLLVSSNYKAGTRKVKLVGEGYFEVAKQKESPFEVSAKEAKVTVLGTVFNIRAFENELETKTTLSEGTVRISHKGKDLVLAPGQQAITVAEKNGIRVQQVEVDQETGWKEGYFRFSEQPLEVILDELTRWYDIDEVLFQKKVHSRITLSLARTRSLADILKRIEGVASVQIEVKGRRIVVK